MRCFASVFVAAGLLLAGGAPRALAQERVQTDLNARVAALESKLASLEQQLSLFQKQQQELLAVQKETLSLLKQSQHARSTQFVGYSDEPAAASSGNAGLLPATGTTRLTWKGPGGATIPIGAGSAQLVDGSELQITTHGLASAEVPLGGVGSLVAGRAVEGSPQSAPAARPPADNPSAAQVALLKKQGRR